MNLCVYDSLARWVRLFCFKKISFGKLEQNAGQIQGCFQMIEPI
ncbi:hypothetical protein BAXH7_03887 [Bacillus amyloliquefaciens XH7]|nr:hypothetical protein BAMTA208_18990 [Bacillus amyloliquefaciens TA208]AEB65422.1 hypothetical protein LL3_03896 [Bacillus amyloliquefaciens LL3]AEK90997.1 hypothetical protein BAXH7_03887 [Bacillus amyloliquefaciens XH7]KYC98848.1 hypothetical protein B425_3315 [Bacillus amyloliquefaciens]QBG58233.1 hypothetical protein D2M30_3934 [Bacillus amyloliquefaciens]